MIFFYCQSYQAFNMALRYRLENEVTIVTASENIIKACNYLGVKYLSHRQFSIDEIIFKAGLLKKELNKILSEIGKNNELHFSHTQYAIFCFLLIYQATKKGYQVVFHDFEFLYNRIIKIPLLNKNNLILKFRFLLIRFLFKAPIQLGMSSQGTYMICLQTQILENLKIRTIHNKNSYFDETFKLFQNIKLVNEKIKILFIAQTLSNENFFVQKEIEKVLSIINSTDIHIKMHPKLQNEFILEKCKRLPDFLPVEFFFNSVTQVVVSFHSASLVTASKFAHLKVISLLDIVGIKDEFITRVKKDLLDKSNGKILFPSTFNELKGFLLNE
jgi:hypothetical protein